jgi:hypothetical protein
MPFVIDSAFGRTLTRRRFAAPTITGGRATPSTYTDTSLVISLQPDMRGQKREIAPPGKRLADLRIAYIEAAAQQFVVGDRIIESDGTAYEVYEVEFWPDILPNTTAWCAKVDEATP